MSIERDLHDLLYAHDLVIVPGFGGFLTHYRSARLDVQRAVIHPPSKDLSYNRHLVRTDGLLTDHVARRERIDHKQAIAVIEGEVDAWHSKINRDGRLELPRIGTFYRDAEKKLQFDPDRRTNYLKDAYGLRAVGAVPCRTGTSIAEKKVIAMPRPGSPSAGEDRQRGFPLLQAAAVVALLSTVGTWWFVSARPHEDALWSGFDLFAADEPIRYTPRSETSVLPDVRLDTASWTLPADLSGVHRIPVPGDEALLLTVDLGGPVPTVAPAPAQAPAPPETIRPAKPDSTAVKTRTPGRRYHIIGGCFLQKENADGFVADLQARGFAAGIIDKKGGLYRVAYGSYPDRSLAQEALQAVRKEEAPEAWMLVQ